MRILLVEDDQEICEMVRDYLEKENFEVLTAEDGEAALRLFDRSGADLVILDLMIPKVTGLEVLQHIRGSSVVPVIILSAKDSETDKTLGLALGADDYMTKPFSVVELLARIRANIRRTTQYARSAGEAEKSGCLNAGELSMNLTEYTVTKAGKPIDLTAKEFEILKLLMSRPSKVYTKEQIYSLVWQEAYLGDENAVNVHISRLRNKIEEDPRNPQYILTVWGIGYKLGEM